MINHCPLCQSTELIVLEQIYAETLIKLYNRKFKINTKGEFSGIKLIKLLFCNRCDLRFFLPKINTSEYFYDCLQQFNWYYLDEKSEYSIASQYIGKKDRILEIGCGKGSFTDYISSSNYIALEFNRKSIIAAKNKGLKVFKESIEIFSKKNMTPFDIVCAFQVLEHINDSGSFVRSCVDCLKVGGLFIISLPSADSFLSQTTNNLLNLPPHHSSWWSDACLKNIPELFPLELIQLKHEKLADIHKIWFLKVMAENAFRNIFGYKFSIVNHTNKWKLIEKLSSIVAGFLIRGFNDPNIMPIGHSVIAVYRKT